MMEHVNAIMLGIRTFPVLAVMATIPILMITILKYKAINLVRISMEYGLVMYISCLVAVVLFPLPTAEEAAALSAHNFQAIPFHFIADFIRESEISMKRQVILQVVCNVIMLIPMGVFLRYYFGRSMKHVILVSFLISLVIEITQLTGIYGIYHGSYRLCDVDDLIANTFGGYMGYRLVSSMEHVIPKISAFDRKIARKGHAYHA